MKKDNRLILVSGTGRDSGKTTLICKIIHFLKDKYDVFALKISTHEHGTNKHMPDFRGEGYSIWVEHTAPEGKDTWRMIQAGAKLVFYVECLPQKMTDAYRIISKLLPDNGYILCESGGLRQEIKPAAFFMADNGKTPKESALELLPLANHVFSLSKIQLFSEKDIEKLLSPYIQL